MILIGRGIRWYRPYAEEVQFCVENQFDFMQIWYRDGELLIQNTPEDKVAYIRQLAFPVIIHAVFDPVDFSIYGDHLLDTVEKLGIREVIVHPVCKKSPVTSTTEMDLAKEASIFSQKAAQRGITWYLENNSAIDGFHYQAEEIRTVFAENPNVEMLLDIAHVDSYRHLEQIAAIKFPRCLHVAGRHFSVPHEHLPLTEGDIDYCLIFQKYLRGFQGRIILEVDGTDEDIIQSKQILVSAAAYSRGN